MTDKQAWEATVKLSKRLVPHWDSSSEIYSNADGSGTSKYKNIAIYKGISEALERWAFHETIDSKQAKNFCFDVNPSTTGMAAFPSFFRKQARQRAIYEASERWALHEFWRGNLPIIEHLSLIPNLRHIEIITPFNNVKVSLLCYQKNDQFLYSFAADSILYESYNHALVELSRNLRVFEKLQGIEKKFSDFIDISDRRIYFFSTIDGHQLFIDKINSSPNSIKVNSKLICDKEIIGPWSEYTKVWRYLYSDSHPDSETDHTFFMF